MCEHEKMACWETEMVADDDDLTKDVASLRAILNESVPFPVEIEREKSACSAVTELQICLDKNIAIQDLLNAKLREVELAMAENEQKMRELERLVRMRKTLKKGIFTIWRRKRNNYFKDHKGQTPPTLVVGNNSLDQLGSAAYFAGLNWMRNKASNPDMKLTQGVRRQIIDSVTQPLQASLMKTTDNEQKLFLRRKVKEISKHTIGQLVRENVTIDWALLAYEQFNNSHTAADCQLRWRGHTHPGVSKVVWKKKEDKELMIIAKTHNFCNWTLIATELGTNRTGFMCLQRYQQSLNPIKFTKVFSMDDDTRLREAVRIYGESRWGLVSAYVDGKTPSQCMQRWVNSLRPGIKRGRWNDKEDKLLREAVRKCGVGNWANIAALVPCRTQAQVRERWVNHMDEKLSKTGWTEEEDSKLIAICQRYSSGPIPWSLVAKEMRTRTDNMCYIRWRSISDAPTIFKKYSESYKQKETVMTNFVGRKRYRHSLRKDDIEEMVPDATKEKLKSYEEMLERKKSRTREYQLPGDPSADSSSASTSGANGGGTSTNRVTAFPPTDMGAATNDGRIDDLGRSSANTADTATPSGTVDEMQPSSYSFPQGRFLYIPPSSSPEPLPTASVHPPMSKPSDPQPHSLPQSLPDPRLLPPPTLPQSLHTFSLPLPPPPLPPQPLLIPHNIRPFLSNAVHLQSRQSLQGVYTLPPFPPPTPPPTTCPPPSGSTFSESEVDSGSRDMSHTSTNPLRIGNLLVPVQRPTRTVVATIWPSARTEMAHFTFPPLFSGQERGGVGSVSSPTPLQQTGHNLPVAVSAHSVSDTHCSSSLPPLYLATPAGGNISRCIGEAMNTLLQETTASGDEAPTQTATNSSHSRDKTPNRERALSTVPAMSSKRDGPLGGQR